MTGEFSSGLAHLEAQADVVGEEGAVFLLELGRQAALDGGARFRRGLAGATPETSIHPVRKVFIQPLMPVGSGVGRSIKSASIASNPASR
jgi:hypothetical protein